MPLPNLSFTTKRILLTRLTCFFWLLAKVISWKLWLTGRLFPVVPPFDFFSVPASIHVLLFILSLVCLAAVIIFPSKKKIIFSLIVIELLSCSLDQHRWQSWEYEYIFIMLALAINNRKDEYAINSMAFIFISVYFFSGLSKMNMEFSRYLQRQLVSSGFFHESQSYLYNLFLYHIGYPLGITELLLSLGLIFKRFMKAAALLLILMHLCILALFGPFGINFDEIIWPWNVLMILSLYLLFIRKEEVKLSVQFLKTGWNKIFILFFGLLPFLNFFGCWDYFLSSSLFSYKTPEMYVFISQTGDSKVLSQFVSKREDALTSDSNSVVLNVQAWALKEMHVPAYPEVRVYKKIKNQLLSRYPGMKATFIIYVFADGRKKRIELK